MLCSFIEVSFFDDVGASWGIKNKNRHITVYVAQNAIINCKLPTISKSSEAIMHLR
ncbi:hypothetical protein GCM10011514_45180 [Emticicia aquatilis]|uniref:Uncharacterized protein n=1 Tax=Emticicia aquatilis TaxID=1537369 RepID=A0A916Z4V2_9BACT|nr:hypothetical protein GCM10011514_45180 [Emticicia aquatilis]